MNELLRGIDAVAFDFFNTLVFHREGHGRGAAVMRYLGAQGRECAPWRHEILYEIFDDYDQVGSPSASPEEQRRRRIAVAERLFERLEIAAPADAEPHAAELWKLLGPEAFEVFSDVHSALSALRGAGYPLAVISNWPKGLGHFCAELGLAEHFETILCSAEVGAAKPDEAIYAEASARLAIDRGRILHIGDTVVDDYTGALAAGFRAVLIDRAGAGAEGVERSIGGLDELVEGL